MSAAPRSVRPASESVDNQREAFTNLRSQLKLASSVDSRTALAELREAGPPDPELTPELQERYQKLVAARSES